MRQVHAVHHQARNPTYLGALMAVMGAAVLFGSL